MAVQVQDVVFKFENSCNCCWKRPIEDEDAVFVTPSGAVRRFDFRRKPGANANALRTLQNIAARLEAVAQDQAKVASILAQMIEQMNLSLEPEVAHNVNASQVRRIEAIAVPVLRAPSPEPILRSPSALVRSPKSRDLRLEQVDHSQAEYEVSD